MPRFIDIDTTLSSAASADACASMGAQQVFNVKGYGAVGDGTTDDRAAIHAARDAAGVGGTVYFPPGTYRIEMLDNSAPGYKYYSGGLHANVAGQTWQLGSAELVLIGDQQDNLITISAPNVSIIGGTLDLSEIADDLFFNAGIAVFSGTVATGVTYGTFGSGAAGAVIRDVTINDAASYGVWVKSTNSVTVTGCTITNFYQCGIIVQTDIDVATDIFDFQIHGNRLETNSASRAAGMGFGANDQPASNFDTAVSRVRRARITNNSCVLPRGFVPGGGDVGAIEMFNAEDCVIDGNITDGGAFGITTGYLRRTVISNNSCSGWMGIGVEVAHGLDSVSVIGNVLNADGAAGPFDATTGAQDAGGSLKQNITGILSAGIKSFRNYTIAGNTITGFTTAAKVGGISLINTSRPSAGGTFDNVTISGNNIVAGGGSALFTAISASATTVNLTVTGNVIDGSSRTTSKGVIIDGTFDSGATYSGISITGNNFGNLDTSAADLTGTLTDIRFTGNVIRNCGTAITGSGVASATRLVVDNTSTVTSTATAAGITNLTTDSTEVQIYTGTTTHTVRLATTNVVAGRRFNIINSSTGLVTVQASDGSTIDTVPTGKSTVCVALQSSPTTNAHWQGQKADTATISGTETLLNKTLTSATLTTPTMTSPNISGGAGSASITTTSAATDAVLYVNAKGVGSVRLGSSVSEAFRATPVASGVNYLSAYAAAAGASPALYATGTDTNINLNLRPAGTGVVQQNGNPVGVKVAVPASAGATGAVGQWAADSSWIYVCTAANTWVRGALATW